MQYIMVTNWNNTFDRKGEFETYYPISYLKDGINSNNIVDNSDCLFVNNKFKTSFRGVFLKVTKIISNRLYFKYRLDGEVQYDSKYDSSKSGWYIMQNEKLGNNNSELINNDIVISNQMGDLKQLIDNIYQIIKDYREDEKLMSKDRIERWVNIFDPQDQEFVLEELFYILKKRYISKEKGKILVRKLIEKITNHFKFASIKDFILQSSFIDHQPEGKSQKILLGFLNEIMMEEYSVSLAECVSKKPKYYIYLDDVLCTGDTLFKALAKNDEKSKGWLFKEYEVGKSNYDIFKENKGVFVAAYFAIHNLSISKIHSRLYFALNKQNFDILFGADDEFKIDNDINVNNSKLDFIYPSEKVKDEFVLKCQEQIEGKMKKNGNEKQIIYRDSAKPTSEGFYSSKENRERFEKIVLNKSIEIYNSSPDLMEKPRPKPLGYGLYSDVSFGFGALLFTWRNVPFNTPLVFWYPYYGWHPLFERKFVDW